MPFFSRSLLGALLPVFSLHAAPLDEWARPDLPFAGVRSSTFGNGRYVAVGDRIFFSTSATNWTMWEQLPLGRHYRSVAFGNNTFVAVGGSPGGAVIASSPYGLDWADQLSLPNQDLRAVEFLNGAFITVGLRGALYTSPDGTNWTQRSSGTSANLHSAAYGNGRWMVGGGDTRGLLLSSTDGVAWKEIEVPSDAPIRSLTYGNGKFVATAGLENVGLPAVYVSEDGLQWRTLPVAAAGTRGIIAITFGKGMFLGAVGKD